MMSINKKLRTLLIVCLAVILGVVLFNIVHLFSHSVEEYIMNARVEGMSLEELENELGQSGIYGRTYEEGFVIYAKSGECPFYQGNYPRFIPVFPCYSGNFWKICFDENMQVADVYSEPMENQVATELNFVESDETLLAGYKDVVDGMNALPLQVYECIGVGESEEPSVNYVRFILEQREDSEWSRESFYEDLLLVKEYMENILGEDGLAGKNINVYFAGIYIDENHYTWGYSLSNFRVDTIGQADAQDTGSALAYTGPQESFISMSLAVDNLSEVRQMAEDNVYMNLTVAYLDDVSVLENWTNLQSLTILYDDVSEDELQELQQMLPECEIFVW